MKLGDYIGINKRWLIYHITLFCLVNIVLIASSTLGKSIGDILYLDILIIVLQTIMLLWDFKCTKQNYKYLEEALDKHQALEYVEYEHSNYYTRLFDRVIEVKHKQVIEVMNQYKQNADRLEEYTTEWVHELKVKVAACDLILEEQEDQELELVERLTLPVEQIKFMVNQLLYIIRANHYSNDLQIENIELSQLVRSRIKENAPFFIHKDINIEETLSPHTVVSDKKWLQYMIGQVLNNSSKYTQEGGAVSIFITEDERALHLHIKDNGIGIPCEELERVFEKGYTGTNGRQGTKSTGMGLYYAKKMADELSIGMEIQSKRGQYTETILSFYKLQDYFKVTKM